MAKGTFGGNITSERIADLGIDSGDIADNAVVGSKILNDAITGAKLADNISITTTGTLDVSGGTLTTSTTQNDAIVDGSTAITRSSNDLTFAGNINASSGTTNNLGTVTTGTINHTVTMTGVPRRKIIKDYTAGVSGSTSAQAKLVAIGTISYPVVTGRTYLIQASYRTFTSHTSSSSPSYRDANYGIAYGTSDRSDEAGISTDTVLQSIGVQYYIDGTTFPRYVGHASNIGAYTHSGTNTTHYAYVFRESGQSDVQTNVRQLILTVEEFDSDVLT